MDTKLTIKNFRVFDEEGISIDLKPITILTGCNSSGKSSIVKAMLLINSFLKGLKQDNVNYFSLKTLENKKIDFNSYPHNLLGRFDKVVHNKSKQNCFSVEYTNYSFLLSQEVHVKLVFSTDKNDGLNNGYIDTITLSLGTESFFHYNRKANIATANINLIKTKCLDFLRIENAIHYHCSLFSEKFEGKISEKDFKDKELAVRTFMSLFEVARVYDVFQHVCVTNHDESIVKQTKTPLDVITDIKSNGYLFQNPIIESLSKIEKRDIWTYVEKECLKREDSKGYLFSKKIIEDFVNSEFEKFSDYYRYYETAYFDRVNVSLYGSYLGGKTDIFYDGPLFLLFGQFSDEKTELESIKSLESQWESGNDKTKFLFIYSETILWEDFKSKNRHSYYYTFEGEPRHYIFDSMGKFLNRIINESLCPIWAGHVEYVGSSRAQIHRLYKLEQKDDFSELLKRYFEAKRTFEDRHFKYKKNRFLKKWIKAFGIGKSISVVQDKEGLGVKIFVRKENGDKRLLADEGYGITQIVSILLQIETSILSMQGIYANNAYGLQDVSPKMYHNSIMPTTITIEEPEIHLHPKYQSLLADMFLEAYQKYNIHFIVETHSEYLIRKTQVLVSKMGFKSNVESDAKSPFRTFYVPQEGKPYSLGYRKDGKFAESFGSGFYDEAANLTFELL